MPAKSAATCRPRKRMSAERLRRKKWPAQAEVAEEKQGPRGSSGLYGHPKSLGRPDWSLTWRG